MSFFPFLASYHRTNLYRILARIDFFKQIESMDDLTTTSEVLHSGTTASISMEIPSFFQKGDLVLVMARMWPGINKEGGVGKVIGVHYDEGNLDFTLAALISSQSLRGRRVLL